MTSTQIIALCYKNWPRPFRHPHVPCVHKTKIKIWKFYFGS